MEPAALFSVQSSNGQKSWVIPLGEREVAILSGAFSRSIGLMPGEAVSTIAEAWRSLDGVKVLDADELLAAEPPPPAEQDMTPPDPATDPATAPIDGVLETPAAQPVEGGQV